MIKVNEFFDELYNMHIRFFSGVPDSLLKNICAYITDHTQRHNHIIAANEGGAVALASGYHLASGDIPMVYMQNSGIGNAINPLLSLTDKEVYSIPVLLMIGWRGEPGVKDEPQHIKQGKVTTSLLDSAGIPYFVIDAETNFKQVITESVKLCAATSAPVALIIKKDTFEPYSLQSKQVQNFTMTREEALENIVKHIEPDAVIVSTTGMLSRELFELRKKHKQNHQSDFLTVGSMGHASQIALGIALLKPNKKVYCLDGDGAVLMHAGGMGIIGSSRPLNFNHIVFNNASHDSVGGQPTIADKIDFTLYAKANQYNFIECVDSKEKLSYEFENMKKQNGPNFLEIRISKGARKDLGRPTTSPFENKDIFMKFLSQE